MSSSAINSPSSCCFQARPVLLFGVYIPLTAAVPRCFAVLPACLLSYLPRLPSYAGQFGDVRPWLVRGALFQQCPRAGCWFFRERNASQINRRQQNFADADEIPVRPPGIRTRSTADTLNALAKRTDPLQHYWRSSYALTLVASKSSRAARAGRCMHKENPIPKACVGPSSYLPAQDAYSTTTMASLSNRELP